MKKLFNEFKEFAVKGNMMDMAIGIIIGASFNTVMDALVKGMLLPPLALLTRGVSFAEQKIIIQDAVPASEGVTATDEIAIKYGTFIETTIDFLIIAFTVFVVVKFLNRLKRRAEDEQDATVATPRDIELLTKMNKLMEEQNGLLRKMKD